MDLAGQDEGSEPRTDRLISASAASEDSAEIAAARYMARHFLTSPQAVHGLPVSRRAKGMVQLVVSELVTGLVSSVHPCEAAPAAARRVAERLLREQPAADRGGRAQRGSPRAADRRLRVARSERTRRSVRHRCLDEQAAGARVPLTSVAIPSAEVGEWAVEATSQAFAGLNALPGDPHSDPPCPARRPDGDALTTSVMRLARRRGVSRRGRCCADAATV